MAAMAHGIVSWMLTRHGLDRWNMVGILAMVVLYLFEWFDFDTGR